MSNDLLKLVRCCCCLVGARSITFKKFIRFQQTRYTTSLLMVYREIVGGSIEAERISRLDLLVVSLLLLFPWSLAPVHRRTTTTI
jgi:hypothetical protein